LVYWGDYRLSFFLGWTMPCAFATRKPQHARFLRPPRYRVPRHAGASATSRHCIAITKDNVFDLLMDAVRVCSLGQFTDALFEVWA